MQYHKFQNSFSLRLYMNVLSNVVEELVSSECAKK